MHAPPDLADIPRPAKRDFLFHQCLVTCPTVEDAIDGNPESSIFKNKSSPQRRKGRQGTQRENPEQATLRSSATCISAANPLPSPLFIARPVIRISTGEKFSPNPANRPQPPTERITLLRKRMSSSSSKSKRHPAWMDKLFPIAFSLGGVALLFIGSQQLRDGHASNRWPKTEGVITESRLAQTGSGRKGYKPIIAYSYTVEREQFSCDRILFGMPSYMSIFKSGRQRSHEWLNRYPEDKKVTVAYNPSEPSQSTLNTGAHMTAWIAPVMGVPFLAVGLFLFRSPEKQKSNES